MTAERARNWVVYVASVWAVSIVLAVLGFALVGKAGYVDLITALSAIAISLGIITFIAWLTSMVAGPVVLIKLRNRPNTLGVWTSIVLPLSIAFAFACAIAFPIGHEYGHCRKYYAAVPLVLAPFYTGDNLKTGFPAYLSYSENHYCGGP